ncbi:hypothetical protein Arub01_34340 [Actinomadura rubrobrunea]|uniref:Integrase catalytic domain-containing protein n=1 Tax=Actinomadura rubrobrunea TaxID=115335 RepID=A0A9W6PWG0_9ACTN|nr:hypothetical protein Arub01_34340 [Actinomadura rubrobrunea]
MILSDERRQTAVAFWQRARQFFASCGITVRRVPADNGSCYRSRLWRDTLAAAGITHKRTRPFRPQTNGKVERYHRTLLDEWAYARPYASETERRAALAPWLHLYNHHRGHTALGGLPPASRVTNLSGQNRVLCSDRLVTRLRAALRQVRWVAVIAVDVAIGDQPRQRVPAVQPAAVMTMSASSRAARSAARPTVFWAWPAALRRQAARGGRLGVRAGRGGWARGVG